MTQSITPLHKLSDGRLLSNYIVSSYVALKLANASANQQTLMREVCAQLSSDGCSCDSESQERRLNHWCGKFLESLDANKQTHLKLPEREPWALLGLGGQP